MQEVTLIFPHQLFNPHPSVTDSRIVYLIEEWLFFQQYRFHKQKLLLHRASMKKYERWLQENNTTVVYIDAIHKHSDVRQLIPSLAEKGVKKIHYTDPADNWLSKRIARCCSSHNVDTTISRTPNFLNAMEETKPFFDKKKTYFQTAFYIEQRKQRKILLTESGEPAGGQWSFDADNRKKYPAGKNPPKVKAAVTDLFTAEAAAYINKYFAHHYGDTGSFLYPTDHAAAALWLDNFLETRFADFGEYEDAIISKEHFLHHSVLTPMLNIGLLSPQQIIEKSLSFAANHNIPLNSTEGFIRQIMGWREFIRIVYEREGCKQRTSNYWKFSRKIPQSFWTGETGIIPVDDVIRKVLKTGYSHHIERLMVMGNFMLLCEFDPDEVYRWFMEMYVDAYDWVMVPNVYGMTQFADGGLMTTKPYISGSNYLLKMSNYKKDKWCDIWDALFWRFMHVHINFFLSNPRLGMLVKTFDKMDTQKQQKHLDTAAAFLQQLDQQNQQP